MSEPLGPFLAAPARAAILIDFDGTLAPIVDDPDQAAALPGTEEVLRRLVLRYRTVGVVSGRPVRYLQDRLGGLDGVHLAGLYGLERVVNGSVEVLPEAARWESTVANVAAAAEAAAPAGVNVERKGLAVTLHVRLAPEHAGWITRFAGDQAATTGLVVHRGRRSVELRPPVEADKGTVVDELAEGCEAVCYLGDDLGDLPAFARLAEMRRAGRTTLAVAAASAEAPPELLARADLVVDGPAGALALLTALAA